MKFWGRINERIRKAEKLGRHYEIGLSYLMQKNLDYQELKQIWDISNYPLLEEYFFEYNDILGQIDKVFENIISF